MKSDLTSVMLMLCHFFCHDVLGFFFPVTIIKGEILHKPDASTKAPNSAALNTLLEMEGKDQQMPCTGFVHILSGWMCSADLSFRKLSW
jgi:hypothetical protein